MIYQNFNHEKIFFFSSITLFIVTIIEITVPLVYDKTLCQITKLKRIVYINGINIKVEDVKIQKLAFIRLTVNTILLVIPYLIYCVRSIFPKQNSTIHPVQVKVIYKVDNGFWYQRFNSKIAHFFAKTHDVLFQLF